MKNIYLDSLLKKKKQRKITKESSDRYLAEYKKWMDARSANPCWYYPSTVIKGKVVKLSHSDPLEVISQMAPWQRKTKVGPFTVSTVFLMFPHGLFRDLYFETMVFNTGAVVAEIEGVPEQVRYHTKQHAMRGHRKICKAVYKSLSKKF